MRKMRIRSKCGLGFMKRLDASDADCAKMKYVYCNLKRSFSRKFSSFFLFRITTCNGLSMKHNLPGSVKLTNVVDGPYAKQQCNMSRHFCNLNTFDSRIEVFPNATPQREHLELAIIYFCDDNGLVRIHVF